MSKTKPTEDFEYLLPLVFWFDPPNKINLPFPEMDQFSGIRYIYKTPELNNKDDIDSSMSSVDKNVIEIDNFVLVRIMQKL